jgi:hypothetical protein
MSGENISFKKALNEFYRLKKIYDGKYDTFVRRIIRNDELSRREKQQKVATFKKKCINCEKNGGTKFTISSNELKAVCGDVNDPCALDIHIIKAMNSNIETDVGDFKSETDTMKEKIIVAKMNILFGYKTEEETETIFEKLKDDFEVDFAVLQEQQLKLNNILNNSMKKVELTRLDNESIFILEQMKVLMKEYNTKRDDALIKEIVDTYHTRLQPLLVNRMNTKYVINRIEQDQEDGTFHLIQKKYNTLELYEPFEESSVVSFKVGK